MIKKLRKAMKSFLARLENANEKAFGSKGLDCCKLNKNSSEGDFSGSTKSGQKQ